MSGTHEIKPPRDIIERAVCGMSEHGVMFREGSGSPEYSSADYAAALGQLGDVIASGLFWGGHMGYPKARRGLIEHLHLWGWRRWAEVCRPGKIDVLLHGRIAALAVFEHCQRKATYDEALKSLGIGAERWQSLKAHYADLQARLSEAESTLAAHLGSRLRGTS